MHLHKDGNLHLEGLLPQAVLIVLFSALIKLIASQFWNKSMNKHVDNAAVKSLESKFFFFDVCIRILCMDKESRA